MLLVDERIGSRDLLEPLRRLGVECDLQHLDFADFAFLGRGINGADVTIGVELKETRDLISSMRSSRFAGHQLPGLITTYDRAWLLTEGIWRTGDEGVLEIMQGGWRTVSLGRQPVMASDLDSWILTQVIRGGIAHHHAATRKDTLRFLSTLFSWWTRKDLEEHRSHQAIYLPPPDRASLIEPSNFVKGMVGLVGDVGWTRATAIETACNGSIRKLSAMSATELRQIPGVGKTIAQKIVAALGDPA